MIFSRPELELILNCAKVKISDAEFKNIKNILQQSIDWQYLITTAKNHKVAPLIYLNFTKFFSQDIPPEVLKQLQKFVLAKTKKNLYFVKELVTVTNIFESHNISVIPYKGLILAAAVYGDISLRQFVDLDFLVPTHQYLKAQNLLIAEGYISPPQTNVDWEHSFVHPQKQIGIDLHQGLTPAYLPFHINFLELWQRLETVSIGGIQVKSFSSEDLLILLCVQLAKDAQWTAEVLIKVCDIAELIRARPDINWDIVWQRCHNLGTKRILLFSLLIVNKLLNTKLPDLMTKKMREDKVAKEAARQVCQNFFSRSEKSFEEKTYQERIFLRKLAEELWKNKFRYFFKIIFTRKEQYFSPVYLPKSLFFIYYLLKPSIFFYRTLKHNYN